MGRDRIRRGSGRRCPGVGGMPDPGNAGPGNREALLSGRWPPVIRGWVEREAVFTPPAVRLGVLAMVRASGGRSRAGR